MKTVAQAPAHFEVSEFGPKTTNWGHTGYLSVSPQGDFSLDAKNDLSIFFTPRKGTTFEQLEGLAGEMNRILENVPFNIRPR